MSRSDIVRRLRKRRIGVLMGGWSSEREVSLLSGQRVLSSLKDQGYQAVGIDISRSFADQIKKAKADGMSEDDQKLWEDEVQDLTNTYIKKIDDQLETKQAEIMQV